MGCGCGGSSASARRAPREQVPAAQQQHQKPKMDGFTWNGPRGQQTAPAESEPAQAETTA